MVRLFVGMLLVGMVAMVAPSEAAEVAVEKERHCVVRVIGQEPNGRLIMDGIDCYDTFAEAIAVASDGTVRLPQNARVTVLETAPEYLAGVASFTLGIHYDYSNGGGSSITVVGSSCTGGWWNTPTWFDNRESSSYNGCNRLKHWDDPGASGSYQSTWTVGQTDNLTYMSNRVESVSYHSS